MKKGLINLAMLVGLFFLTQVPLGFMSAFSLLNGQNQQHFTFIQMLIVVVLLLAVIHLFIRWGKKHCEAEFHLSIITKNWKIIIGVWLLSYVITAVGSMIMQAGGDTTTVNQEALDTIARHVPMSLMWLVAAIGAPIMEETIFRMGITELFFKDKPKVAMFVGALAFGLAHSPTNIGSFIIYAGLGLLWGAVYLKTRQVEVTIAIHALFNTVGVLAMYLVSGMG